MKDLLLYVNVVVKTLNLEISGCRLTDYVNEMFFSAHCGRCTIIFLIQSILSLFLALSLQLLSSLIKLLNFTMDLFRKLRYRNLICKACCTCSTIIFDANLIAMQQQGPLRLNASNIETKNSTRVFKCLLRCSVYLVASLLVK